MDGEGKSKIEQLRDALYSKVADGIFEKKRHVINEDKSIFTKDEWQNGQAKTNFFPAKKEIPYQKILVIAFLFFSLASIFAFYEFSIGLNTVSSAKIDILVTGPTNVSGGEVFPLDIEVQNNGVS